LDQLFWPQQRANMLCSERRVARCGRHCLTMGFELRPTAVFV
jgi:hypothetical protein